jgi:hypothetical protein
MTGLLKSLFSRPGQALAASVFLMVTFMTSCTPPPFNARSLDAPPIKYCNDITGHRRGASPIVLGGTCTCTPTEKHYRRCINEKTIANNMTYAEFLQLYESRGYKTDLDHRGCNNMCEWGPHVVFGGRCMATPTPGTLNYERVVSGMQNLTQGEIHVDSTL